MPEPAQRVTRAGGRRGGDRSRQLTRRRPAGERAEAGLRWCTACTEPRLSSRATAGALAGASGSRRSPLPAAPRLFLRPVLEPLEEKNEAMEDLRGKVVIVTGASSGLGREVAVQLAAEGCSVALAARSAEGLEETARDCRDVGGNALAVVTDVSREEDVTALVDTVLREWGAVDVLVNNAAVTIFAQGIEDGSFEDHRRVIETNVLGMMLCARAVVPIFRRQKRGVLVNVSSILGKIGQPFVPSYVVSKFAVRGLSEALRTELADEPDIHVCSLFPFAIDTPHFEAAAYEKGRPAVALPPMQSPEKVARALVDLIKHPRRERHVPRVALLGLALHAMAPSTVEQLLLHSLRAWHFDERQQPKSEGNLYAPSPREGPVHGHRPPRVGTVAFAAWVLRELVRIEAERTRRRVRRWRARAA